jgi:DNA-binding response OmpR family regulator
MRVLIVEDDHAIVELLLAVFRRVGIDADVAADGLSALRKLRSETYSALLLDIMLPEVNGFEVVREMASFAPSLLQRTIIMTAASQSTLRDFDRSQVFALIRKPFDLEELLATITRCTAVNTSSPRRSYSLRAMSARHS